MSTTKEMRGDHEDDGEGKGPTTQPAVAHLFFTTVAAPCGRSL